METTVKEKQQKTRDLLMSAVYHLEQLNKQINEIAGPNHRNYDIRSAIDGIYNSYVKVTALEAELYDTMTEATKQQWRAVGK